MHCLCSLSLFLQASPSAISRARAFASVGKMRDCSLSSEKGFYSLHCDILGNLFWPELELKRQPLRIPSGDTERK